MRVAEIRRHVVSNVIPPVAQQLRICQQSSSHRIQDLADEPIGYVTPAASAIVRLQIYLFFAALLDGERKHNALGRGPARRTACEVCSVRPARDCLVRSLNVFPRRTGACIPRAFAQRLSAPAAGLCLVQGRASTSALACQSEGGVVRIADRRISLRSRTQNATPYEFSGA